MLPTWTSAICDVDLQEFMPMGTLANPEPVYLTACEHRNLCNDSMCGGHRADMVAVQTLGALVTSWGHLCQTWPSRHVTWHGQLSSPVCQLARQRSAPRAHSMPCAAGEGWHPPRPGGQGVQDRRHRGRPPVHGGEQGRRQDRRADLSAGTADISQGWHFPTALSHL